MAESNAFVTLYFYANFSLFSLKTNLPRIKAITEPIQAPMNTERVPTKIASAVLS